MKHRITTGIFNPNQEEPMPLKVVMVCPEAECEHVWEAPCTMCACPRCGNRNVIPASMWNVDEQAILKMGRLPLHLPKKGACHDK
ncbi:MAG: hypothetical protein KKF12_12155 [Proteobacteria bacterium]|nr:hypothetical protein [Desulfobacula sp.]MBU3953974.1 hypothetical protein [Pseudomonadota bacterium]MBU4131565.1 hypothetical protein [Pseudomonadota bacterium]